MIETPGQNNQTDGTPLNQPVPSAEQTTLDFVTAINSFHWKDESYFIGKVGTTPDLSIEVVFTSGNLSKLNRYQELGVPEIWFWEDGLLTLHHLRASGYERIYTSELLKDLDINLLTRCVLMTSRLEAIREFRRGISQG